MSSPKKTVLCVTGTRAEWGLLEQTVLSLRDRGAVSVDVLVTGMHTQKRFGYTHDIVRAATDVAATVAIGEHDDQLVALSKEIAGIAAYCDNKRPDAILVLGDRDEAYAAATVAVHLGIPVIHLSGGDVSGPTVDHYLRNAITVFSKLHLVQTELSQQNVLALGADSQQTFVVGSAGLSDLDRANLTSRAELAQKYDLDEEKDWVLVVMHPTALDGAPLEQQIGSVIDALAEMDTGTEKIVLAPNADDGSDTFFTTINALQGKKSYHLHTHIERIDYLALLCQSVALIGNSSSGLVEGGFLKVPFIHVGNRQKHRECGPNVLFTDYNADEILGAIATAQSESFQQRLEQEPCPYTGGDVTRVIVGHIEEFCAHLPSTS